MNLPVPDLPPDEVHVWRVSTLTTAQESLAGLLSTDERRRADRFAFDEPRQRFIIARGVLRSLLGAYLDTAPGSLRFVYSDLGKPALQGPAGDLSFNLAHSGDLVLLAVTRRRDLGVDVERTRRPVEWEKVARRFFQTRELAALMDLSPDQRRPAFFRCWTRKEAYLKATGQGVALGLDSCAVTLAPAEAGFLWLRDGRPEDWRLADVDAGPGYAGAVCAAGRDWRLQQLTWPAS